MGSSVAASEILARKLRNAREQSDSLFHLIDPEAIYDRPIPERHRLIFYLGHFEAFDWIILARRGSGERPFHPEFDRLFERGIDPEPGMAVMDTPSDWPSRDEVERYRARTREWVDAHVSEVDPMLLQMAIEHRHMHAETFAYLMHAMPYAKKVPHQLDTADGRETPTNPMITIPAGETILGQAAGQWGWDNEFRAHEVRVSDFAISKFKISNGEYLEFVRAGGPAPHFWCDKGDWRFRGMFAEVMLPLSWPVWVTWEQAKGFAEWRGMSLPSEAEFQLAATLTPHDPWCDNYAYRRWNPIPVDAGDRRGEANRPLQMVGNGWEWTCDEFDPFSGFEPHPFYPAYSADFFDRRHYVMKGASPRTAKMLTRPSFRNWFRPDYPYMYAGFRVVDRR